MCLLEVFACHPLLPILLYVQLVIFPEVKNTTSKSKRGERGRVFKATSIGIGSIGSYIAGNGYLDFQCNL